MKRIISVVALIALFVFAGAGMSRMALAESSTSGDQLPAFAREIQLSGPVQIAPQVEAAMDSLPPGQKMTVIVRLRPQVDLSAVMGGQAADHQQAVIQALQANAAAAQQPVRARLEALAKQGLVDDVTYFWIFDGLAVTATPGVIRELAARADVFSITPNETDIVPASPMAYAVPEANLSAINAAALWDMGFMGQGIVIASMDSGVDASHPDLQANWRGGANSWLDPYGQHASPYDSSGHGTWTMGIMAGGGAGGTSIGVAPQAQWIAVKIFSDSGSATTTGIHTGFQWLLDPDGNPATDDAPDVVNNSWVNGAPGCSLEFQADLQALRAVGILPVFAAGNFGPNSQSSASPANNPEAFAVGAVNNSGSIDPMSSRGPSACGESASVYPEIVAPGVNIRTADRGGFYTTATGTSIAAPHASGVLALLLNAFPGLTADQQAAALLNSAVDLGQAGPDNDFGNGMLDASAAYQWLLDGGAVSTPSPTPTPSPEPVVNLALNRPVTVSSASDSAHSGAFAVDGDLSTFWQTAKASGKNKLSDEWITVDLGSTHSVGRVVLEWDIAYATGYAIDVSTGGSAWTSVYVTTTGDGAADIIDFSPVSARYVRLMSTVWNSGSVRIMLREFEVYAAGATPTPEPTPIDTPSPSPSPSPPPTGGMLHSGDLDGTGVHSGGGWLATVTVTVHGSDEAPVGGVTVTGSWSGGYSGSASCVTDSNGQCSVVSAEISAKRRNVSFTVSDLALSGWSYDMAANHDAEGDSDGTTIRVLRP